MISEEQKLSRSLSRIYSQIKSDLGLVLAGGRITWQEITRDFKPKADDSIRSAVEEIYRLSAKKVSEQKLKQPFFTTELDRQQQRQLTQRYQDWFWIGLEREIVKKTATAVDPRTLHFDTALELKDSFLDRMVVSVVTEVSAMAVLAKSQQLLLQEQGQVQIAPVHRSFPRSFTTYKGYRIAALYGPAFVWHTRESAVLCPQCEALKNRTWKIDDLDIPVPVLSTHPNCRCKLELLI